MRYMFGFFPAGSRGGGQYQPQIHAIRVAGVQRFVFDTQPTAEADGLVHDRPDCGVRTVLFDLDAPLRCWFSGRFGDA